MTDNEIIKAYENLYHSLNKTDRKPSMVEMLLLKDVLGLLKRQIERLKDLNPVLECESREACDMTNKCGSCAYAVPATFGKAHCYVECTNREHVDKYCKSPISLKRQRTHPACRCYAERKEDEGK